MKITYEFEPYEDKYELCAFQQATKLYSLICDFLIADRRSEDLSEDLVKGYERALEDFRILIEKHGVNIEY